MFISERNSTRERNTEEKTETPYWQNPNFAPSQNRNSESYSGFFGENANIAREIEISQRIAEEEDNVELAPTAKTMAAAKTGEKTGISTRGKIIFVTYLVLFVALGLLILITSLAIQSSLLELGLLSGNAELIASEVEGLNNQIAEGIDEDLLIDMVSQVGLAPATEAQINYYSNAHSRGYQAYVIEKNWFDVLCDFFSGALK